MSLTALGKIAIVDSNENIATLLSTNLRSEGYDVLVFPAANAVTKADLSNVRLILADAMEQPYSGLDLLHDIKNNPATSSLPFIICSDSDSERNIIDALDAGADDYILKPFSLRELVARIKAVIRRHSYSTPAPVGSEIIFHTLSFDTVSGRVSVKGHDIKLTKTEASILKLLLERADNYVSRAEIYRTVWDEDPDKANDRIVDTNISRLRKKLDDLASHLINRSGLGYMMKR